MVKKKPRNFPLAILTLLVLGCVHPPNILNKSARIGEVALCVKFAEKIPPDIVDKLLNAASMARIRHSASYE